MKNTPKLKMDDGGSKMAKTPRWAIALFAILYLLSSILNSFSQVTQVMFPVSSLFGGAAYNQALTITAANTLISDGQNLWAGTYTIIPASTTNPVVGLYPNTYLLTVPGVVKPVRFTVPASTNTLDVTTLLTHGPLFYFGTNGMANLMPSNNITFTTNADGSIFISSTGGGGSALTNNQVLAGIPVITNASQISGVWVSNLLPNSGVLPEGSLTYGPTNDNGTAYCEVLINSLRYRVTLTNSTAYSNAMSAAAAAQAFASTATNSFDPINAAANALKKATNSFQPTNTYLTSLAGGTVPVSMLPAVVVTNMGSANYMQSLSVSNGTIPCQSTWFSGIGFYAISDGMYGQAWLAYNAKNGAGFFTTDTNGNPVNVTFNGSFTGFLAGSGAGLTNTPLALGTVATGSNGAAAIWMVGLDAAGNPTTNAVPSGSGGSTANTIQTNSAGFVPAAVQLTNVNNTFSGTLIGPVSLSGTLNVTNINAGSISGNGGGLTNLAATIDLPGSGIGITSATNPATGQVTNIYTLTGGASSAFYLPIDVYNLTLNATPTIREYNMVGISAANAEPAGAGVTVLNEITVPKSGQVSLFVDLYNNNASFGSNSNLYLFISSNGVATTSFLTFPSPIGGKNWQSAINMMSWPGGSNSTMGLIISNNQASTPSGVSIFGYLQVQ
jgi:hypothetical protein